jgi:hypothetical protein
MWPTRFLNGAARQRSPASPYGNEKGPNILISLHMRPMMLRAKPGRPATTPTARLGFRAAPTIILATCLPLDVVD